MHPELIARASMNHGLFTTREATDLGHSPAELQDAARRREIVRLRRGVYCLAAMVNGCDARETHILHARAALMKLTVPSTLSHCTAAAVHGFELLDHTWEVVEVTRSERRSARLEASVHHHTAELAPADVVLVDELPVTCLARTAVDVARSLPFDAGVVAIDTALRLGARLADIRRVFDGQHTWRGGRTAGRAVAFADAGAESVGESLCRVRMCEGGVPAPRTQADIRDGDGRFVARVDFLFEAQRTVVEFDGKVKYGFDDAAQAADALWKEKRREDQLRELGFEVVRFVWADLTRPAEMGRRVRSAFGRAGVRGVAA